MGSNDELFTAMNMFQQGMQKYHTAQGINDASKQMNDVAASEMDEMQKRQANEMIAKNLALRLTATGANPQQVAQASGSIMPAAFKDSQDMYLQGLQKGDQKMQDVGQQGMKVENAPKLEQIDRSSAGALAVAKEHSRAMLAAAGVKADAKNAPKQLPPHVISKITDLENSIQSTQQMMDKFNDNPQLQDEIGPVAGIDLIKSWRNTEFGDFKAQVGRDFDLYRKAITGAGAGIKELKMLEANRPTVRDNPKLFMDKIRTIQKLAQAQRDKTVSNFGKAKYDVSQFQQNAEADAMTRPPDEGGQQQAAPLPAGIPKGSVLETRPLKGGGVKKVYRAPSGDLYDAEVQTVEAQPKPQGFYEGGLVRDHRPPPANPPPEEDKNSPSAWDNLKSNLLTGSASKPKAGWSEGGVVPGSAPVKGNSPKNDVVDAKLSPGEIVIPRTVVQQGPQAVVDFVARALNQGAKKKKK